jgi:hypothetical protein
MNKRDAVITLVSAVINKAAVESGSIILSGWIVARTGLYKHIPDNDPRLIDLRDAYMGGAQHLFATMMSVLAPEDDVTPGDERIMEGIFQELENWAAYMRRKHNIV